MEPPRKKQRTSISTCHVMQHIMGNYYYEQNLALTRDNELLNDTVVTQVGELIRADRQIQRQTRHLHAHRQNIDRLSEQLADVTEEMFDYKAILFEIFSHSIYYRSRYASRLQFAELQAAEEESTEEEEIEDPEGTESERELEHAEHSRYENAMRALFGDDA